MWASWWAQAVDPWLSHLRVESISKTAEGGASGRLARSLDSDRTGGRFWQPSATKSRDRPETHVQRGRCHNPQLCDASRRSRMKPRHELFVREFLVDLNA